MEQNQQAAAKYLTSTLNIHFVSDVRIEPNTLTIFNHPSNIIPLGLSLGSGHYHAEIETVHQPQSSSIGDLSSSSSTSRGEVVLKINQITESSVIVSPSANNGLTYLHIYDYCVPPSDQQSNEMAMTSTVMMRLLPPSIHNNRVMTWPPYATAKIQVAGINSILVNYEDDKVQVKSGLKIYVQISDATGNLIRTKYFPLMNLRAKLANVDTSSVTSPQGTAASSSSSAAAAAASSIKYGSTSLANVELDVISRSETNSDEYTAVYVLNAKKIGVVSVQFEALSDGTGQTTDSASSSSKKSSGENLIQSGVKEIQIYSPLRVQPKYIELIL